MKSSKTQIEKMKEIENGTATRKHLIAHGRTATLMALIRENLIVASGNHDYPYRLTDKGRETVNNAE